MPTPLDKKLYAKIKKKIKARVKVWPSAYASGQLVKEYKRLGGKYSVKTQSPLKRWFKEQWVDVCNGYKKCGRKKSQKKNYPYCRPLKRVDKNTPKTVKEITKAKLKKMCAKKRRNPYKRMAKV